MTAREKLQYSYELAFYPPSLHHVWDLIKSGGVSDLDELRELLDMALLLHQALPENGFASQRALNRLAMYQAKSRAFGLPGFLKNIRRKLGCDNISTNVVPGHMVRDIGIPPLNHHAWRIVFLA